MLCGKKKNIYVSGINPIENGHLVSCKIPNYMEIRKYISVGELIETKEPFDLNFNGRMSKWSIIFFPNGQYDCDGVASNNWCVYIKLISCDQPDEAMRMNISITLSSLRSSKKTDDENISVFFANENRRRWAGPFQVNCIEENFLDNILIIKCAFQIISNRKKRTLSHVGSSLFFNSLKKRRGVKPSEEKQKSIDFSSEDVGMTMTRDPFETKSPLRCYCNKSRRQLPITTEVNCEKKEKCSKFRYQKPSSQLNRYQGETHGSPETGSKPISSGCLSVSDIDNNNRDADEGLAGSGFQPMELE
ncbi:hypothetical protein Bhyg_11394 [Pseudolycoriella hygida]|uniref:MATH domain-containing protein n=1 Tax=Pseudolycoriella hygida TaxID=35572 RepID=A0A9Q0RZJ7_9DIPT|nr:hypothetical protein Bhyg_11394 [Pseudolycoriella hygida]